MKLLTKLALKEIATSNKGFTANHAGCVGKFKILPFITDSILNETTIEMAMKGQ